VLHLNYSIVPWQLRDTLLARGKYIVTTLEIDKTLLQEALDLSKHPTPTTLIEAALREYVQRRKQLKGMELFGTIDYDNEN